MRSLLSFASRTFQSTPPVKAATLMLIPLALADSISIHAAREGGDRKRLPRAHKAGYFNPRRP